VAVFTSPSFTLHRQVVFCNDPEIDLRAVIAIHDTTFGPALGGCRMWPYGSEDEAVEDVLRLARGMTYKASLAGIPLGGGKSVIIGDPARRKSEALFESFGRFVASLGGRYVVAEDVGTSVADMQIVRRETEHVRGIPETGGGDPSPVTAFGVYNGVRAAVRYRLGRETLAGVRVTVQGLGHVGMELCRLLVDEGAELTVTDINPDAIRAALAALPVRPVEPDAIVGLAAEVFAPCALGAGLNDETIPRLEVSIVAGAANNQLAEDRHGAMLRARGILYAPDYAINAGGLINIAHEGAHYDRERALADAAGIYDTLLDLFARADREDLPTNETADRIAEERVLSHWDWRPVALQPLR
jgi:leucine dehydrogenase